MKMRLPAIVPYIALPPASTQSYDEEIALHRNPDIPDFEGSRVRHPGAGVVPETRHVFGQGVVYQPEEGVDRVVSLKLHTYRSAEFHYAEQEIGSLEPGKFADFVVVDKDYLSGPDTEIRDNKILMTVLSGETRYKDAAYNPVQR